MRQFIYLFLLSFILVIFSLAIAPVLFGQLAFVINPALLFLVFAVLFFDFNLSLFYVLITGLLFDFYSPFFFGFYLLLFLIELGLIKAFIYYFLRQQNIFTYLILNFLAIVIWYLAMSAIVLLANFNFFDFVSKIFYQSLTHFVLVFSAYKFWPPLRAKLSVNLID